MQILSHHRHWFPAGAQWLIPVVAMAGLTAWPQGALAGTYPPREQTAEPVVIAGIGSPEAAQMFGPQPVHLQQPRPMRVSSNLGGGFIEMMLGGKAAGARYNDPGASPANYAPHPRLARTQRQIDPMFQRQDVDYSGPESPGTLVVDTPNRFLYYVAGNGRAIRYGIGVGRPGFEWAGVKTVSRKAEWPSWTPPAEMLLRRPDLPTFMPGGTGNPLGARALYLGSSLYRIHGTNEPWTIGTNVSSGCIRMMNEDVVDLYQRVHIGSKVIVM